MKYTEIIMKNIIDIMVLLQYAVYYGMKSIMTSLHLSCHSPALFFFFFLSLTVSASRLIRDTDELASPVIWLRFFTFFFL